MSLINRSKAVAREKTSRMTRYVRATPGKKLTVQAIVAAAALAGAASLGSLAVDVAKPWVIGQLQPSKKLAAVSGEWRGIYFSPSSHASKRTAPQTNVAVMCHEKGVQTWNVNQRGESFTAAISEPSTANDKILHWNGTGFLKDQSTLVVSTVGDRAGVGTMFLSRHPDHGYYRGFAYLCDCHSYVAEAVMICPYVLYKADSPLQKKAAENDPLVAGADQRCRTLPEMGQILPVPVPVAVGASAPACEP